MVHNLRVAAIVASCVTTACLAVLWMRSFALKDVIWVGGQSPQLSRISTSPGRVILSTRRNPYEGRWVWDRSAAAERSYSDSTGRRTTNYWFRVLHWSQFTEVHLPMWLLVLFGGGVGATCTWPWHYSLRGLLLATTVVAIILGLGLLARTWSAPEPIAMFGGVELKNTYELLEQ